MKRNINAVLVGIVVAGVFLYLIFPPSPFNFIPFAIHQSVFHGVIKESTFIKLFDIGLALLVFYICFRKSKKSI